MNIVIMICFDTWEHRADLLRECFERAGHKVTVLISDYRHIEKERRADQKEGYVFFRSLPYNKNISVSRFYSHWKISRKMREWLDKNAANIDLIWAMGPPNSFFEVSAAFKNDNPHTNLIIDIMDLWPEALPGITSDLPGVGIWRGKRDKALKVADYVTTECDYFRKILSERLDSSKVSTLYLARKEKQIFPEVHLPEDYISLCHLGSVNNITDIDTIGEIIRKFKAYKPVRIHIIGCGEKMDELVSTVRKNGAEVIEHGEIYDPEEKQSIFDECHFGLNIMKPTVTVGLTMKSLDYFETGLPIINSLKGDTESFVRKYHCGYNLCDDIPYENAYNIDMRDAARRVFLDHLTAEGFEREVNEIIALITHKK